MLVHAYRLVKGDRIDGMAAPVASVKGRSASEVSIEFESGHIKTYNADTVLRVHHAGPARRPKYRNPHK